jgi:hypothetical protein
MELLERNVIRCNGIMSDGHMIIEVESEGSRWEMTNVYLKTDPPAFV